MDFTPNIVVENDYWIAFNKPVNISVQPDKSKDKCILELASEYLHKPAHIINRIDRPVSGLMLIAKSAEVKDKFRELFATRKVRKSYLAITQKKPPQQRDRLHNYLKKNERKNKSFVELQSSSNTKDAYLIYQYLSSIERYHLLKVRLITGRHHQIRAQLAYIGCPIRGDIKYGYPRANRKHSIQLHSWKIHFQDPWSMKDLWLYAPPPQANIWNAFNVQELQKIEIEKYGESN